MRHNHQTAEVADVPGAGRPLDSLMVHIDGRLAGLIHFRRSNRPIAAADLLIVRRRIQRPLAIGLVSEEDASGVARLAASLGVDFHEAGLSSSDLVRLIRTLRNRGLKVGYIGDCLAHAAAAHAADLAVEFDAGDLEHLDQTPAAVVLLQPRLNAVAALYDAARSQLQGIREARNAALGPNLLCVAGAFLMGFTSMTTVIVTNLGTFRIHARASATIRNLNEVQEIP